MVSIERRDRLVESPVFLLSPPRSGSTLLRMILDTHPEICAPHELNLRAIRVTMEERRSVVSMRHIGLNAETLEYLLWDRILHRELAASGKRIIVEKTPFNVLDWRRFATAWPAARFIFLQRHPVAIASSLAKMLNRPVGGNVLALVTESVTAMQDARKVLKGPDVRYEDLVSDPVHVMQRLCEYLEVPWDRNMLDYGSADHGPFNKRLGDVSENIRSGRIRTNTGCTSLDGMPPVLEHLARQWGYNE